MKSKTKLCLLTLYVVLGSSTIVCALTQPLGDSGWEIVVRSDLVEGGQVAWPYIYSVTDDAVTIQIDKIFNRPFTQDGLNYPIIVEFLKVDVDAVPKIIIRDEYIGNETGTEWYDYHMHLIVDALDPQAGFDPSFIPDGDQLEDVSFDQNSYIGYNGLPIKMDFVDNDGNGVLSSPPNPLGENIFQPGYYGGQVVIVTDPDMQPYEHFGLKEIPTSVPEPVTFALLGTASIWIFTRKRHSFRNNRNK